MTDAVLAGLMVVYLLVAMWRGHVLMQRSRAGRYVSPLEVLVFWIAGGLWPFAPVISLLNRVVGTPKGVAQKLRPPDEYVVTPPVTFEEAYGYPEPPSPPLPLPPDPSTFPIERWERDFYGSEEQIMEARRKESEAHYRSLLEARKRSQLEKDRVRETRSLGPRSPRVLAPGERLKDEATREQERAQAARWAALASFVREGAKCSVCGVPYASVKEMLERRPRIERRLFGNIFIDEACRQD